MSAMTRTPAAVWAAQNDPVIDAFRANGGQVKGRKHPVLLLTTTGARTGRPRVTPLDFSRDGDRLVVIASMGGSSHHPYWYLNLEADPEVIIEVGRKRFRARARITEEPERTRLFDRQAAEMPFFDGFRKRVRGREIPVVVFERVGPADAADRADAPGEAHG
jgi:deazaflavin-dependent oxidoreductase (nitroreductase family)